MRHSLRHLHHDERGMVLIFVGLGFLAFLSATLLAIDVGMFATARAQAQNSADAGALAGAVALVFDDPNDRSSSGPAVQSALSAARGNQVIHQVVSVNPSDVTFPAADQVRVDVFRTGGRGNPLATLIGRYFGVPTADVTATATAEVFPANAATCVKPWAIPDKWNEQQTPPWDLDDSFDLYYPNGNPLPNPDIYVPVNQGGYTGYRSSPTGSDYGMQVVIKPGNPNQAISASHYYPIALPPGTGASWYEENIPGCWPGTMEIGGLVPVEPGNMTGPTTSGTQTLIDRDPGAYWDASANKVVSSYSPSPRIVVIPVFDPQVYEESRQHGRQDIQVANLIGVFIEALQGSDVVGRLVPMTGLLSGTAPDGAYLKSIQLVN